MPLVMREDLERLEGELLAPYAQHSAQSRGREAPEPPDPYRTEFQRDRDRIIHSSAFRKLEYKTQVYVTHEGDFFRTRLTHTIEVAQIARTLAQRLGLNPDLTEAIALAHDLGHTPFGHTGETVLDELMREEGGFEHNAQSLRIVELLEERFHDRPGLNLTWEVRAGIAQHSTAYDRPEITRYHEGSASLESRIADLSDEIAYNNHDIDDALDMGLLHVEQLREVPWVWAIWESVCRDYPADVPPRILKFRALGRLMETMIGDVLTHTSRRLDELRPRSPGDAAQCDPRLADFSPAMREGQVQLREFLMRNVYRHPTTLKMQMKAARFLKRLFLLYEESPELLPLKYQSRVAAFGLRRVITDYLSGMTDRYCLEEYMTHFEPTLRRE
ncbi:MAG: Deoxyguanosinetriphosphate triphosphohydrolase [candidate division BRC1 bacterium ADurb.BinA292]|nr:MAG: Deoxyguanosinetriphosphate triphosphohydrolase [candidate division BRC1 bacterium ADurb.BinA292]